MIIPKPTAPQHFNKQTAQPTPAPVQPVAQSQPVKAETTVQEAVAERPQPVETPVAVQQTPVVPTNAAMQYIFAHESGGNPYAINASSGACGLGQALPCSKLLNVCGSLSNVECQIEFFSNYANSRYGGWAASMYFWQNHSWW